MSQQFWKLISMTVVLALALSACGTGNNAQATPTPLPPLVSYEAGIFTVEQDSIVSEKSLLGEIVPAKQDQMFFRSSGFVTRITVKRGDLVEAGDVLAELQIDDLLAQLQQAQIDLEVAKSDLESYQIQHAFEVSSARANVSILEKQLEKAQIQVDESIGSARDIAILNLDIAEQNLIIAQESLAIKEQETNPYAEQVVKRNQLSLQRLETLLSERRITAPYDGIILKVNLREGQSVEGYSTVIDIGDPSDLVVRAQFDWEIRDQLSSSTEAYMYLSTSEEDEDTSWPVTFLPNFLPISETEATESLIPTADYFYFELENESENEEFTVGRSIFLKVILGRKENALLLPPAAIREYKGLYFVIVQDGDRRRRVEINEIGLQSTEYWEVIGDLQPGDQVVGP
jgi:multidrug efflux pump subunit AcrA (membrane-fusion protein)